MAPPSRDDKDVVMIEKEKQKNTTEYTEIEAQKAALLRKKRVRYSVTTQAPTFLKEHYLQQMPNDFQRGLSRLNMDLY